MLLTILQVIFLALWYAVPALQFIPWWVAWMPALIVGAMWTFTLFLAVFGLAVALLVNPNK